MKARSFTLQALALGGALLLVHPASDATGFTLLGYSLGVGQRDARLFNNFSDPQSNDNTLTKLQFPGAIGAEQAIWKGIVEWNSTVHGTGQGDPLQSVGDGGANFDGIWMGIATGIGNTNQNITSTISSCSAGTLAYMEGPSTDGWRIRFCDSNATYNDGPGNVGSNFDIQAVMTHEYGHAVGLGHSASNQATMAPSIGAGSTSERSINADDKNGIKAIYGTAAAGKPIIYEIDGNGGSGTITIRGYNFDTTGNEVWFTPSAVTATGADPRVRVFGVASTNGGTLINVAVPAAARVGDVLVKGAGGGSAMSNAFPSDHVGVITSPALAPFNALAVTPSTVEALDPGTAKSVSITGYQLDTTVSITMNGNPVSASRWTAADGETIDIDLPLGLLGTNTLELSDGVDTTSVQLTIVEPASPLLELGTGDPANAIANGSSMNIVVAGQVGSKHQVYYSGSPVPSVLPLVCFDLGNNFTNLNLGAVFTIGPDGYRQVSVPVTYLGAVSALFYAQSVDVSTAPAPKFGVSNLQTVTLTP